MAPEAVTLFKAVTVPKPALVVSWYKSLFVAFQNEDRSNWFTNWLPALWVISLHPVGTPLNPNSFVDPVEVGVQGLNVFNLVPSFVTLDIIASKLAAVATV